MTDRNAYGGTAPPGGGTLINECRPPEVERPGRPGWRALPFGASAHPDAPYTLDLRRYAVDHPPPRPGKVQTGEG